MSALWTSAEIAEATKGVVTQPFEVTGLSIDTRTLIPGDLFVALKNERDGHDFIDAALKAGATGILAERDMDGPIIKVVDTMQALEDLGRARRSRCSARRVAVTGSVGKTSVKNALSVMLAPFGQVHSSARSFNNHIGVPITLATIPENTDFAVFETGMNHAGELTDLSRQVAPHVALITTVAGAHKANFDSVEAIADAKAEIRHGLTDDGILILNVDNEYTPRIKVQADGLQIMTFGTKSNCDVVILSSDHHPEGGRVTLGIGGETYEIPLSVTGAHWDYNVAACMAVAHALRVDLAKAAKAMSNVSASKGRGDTHTVTIGAATVTLIDESYNANPESMQAAISAAALKPGRKIAVLGDMRELGSDELAEHAALSGPLEASGFARVFTIGECMRSLRGSLPRTMRAAHADTIDEMEQALADEIQNGDVLLIKGSNATGLGRLAARLKAKGNEDAV